MSASLSATPRVRRAFKDFVGRWSFLIAATGSAEELSNEDEPHRYQGIP
jgi:hypothetical protein